MQIIFLIIILVFIVIAFALAAKNNVNMIYFFLFMVLIQNITVIIFSAYIPQSYNVLFSIIKETMLYASLVISFLLSGKIVIHKNVKLYNLCLSIYLVVLAKNLIITPAELNSAIVSLRFLLVPIICLCIGRNIKITRNEFTTFLQRFVVYSTLLASLGLIELLLLGDSFWQKIGYSLYAVKMKGNHANSLFRGVTVNFYSWDFSSSPFRRLVSITADPLATAFLIFLGALIILTGCASIKNFNGRVNVNLISALFLIATSVLCMSKGIFVFMAIAMLTLAYFKHWLPKKLLYLVTTSVVLAIIYMLVSYSGNSGTATASTNHVEGLLSGLSAANLAGNGLGTAGVTTAMLTGAETTTRESYVGTLFAQIGYVGGLSFIGLFLAEGKHLLNLYRTYKNKFLILSFTCLIGVFVCSIFSESAISIMGTGIYFVIIGITEQERLYFNEIDKSKVYKEE